MARTDSTSWARARGLTLAVLGLYVLAQIGAAITGWVEFVAEQTSHQQSAEVFGPDGYVWTLLEQTMQNWQSEFLALATLVALSAHLIHKGSKHSREGNDEAIKRMQSIQRRVRALEAAEG
jgi:hypothetical protein